MLCHEYVISLIPSIENKKYDGIILAVKQKIMVKLGKKGLLNYLSYGAVFYDIIEFFSISFRWYIFMESKTTKIKDLLIIKPDVFKDNRGFFYEVYSEKKFNEMGINTKFVQDNHSFSAQKNVVRGLHFQTPPCSQSKLVRVIKGAVFDVVVDLRKQSKTYGQWQGFELTEDNFLMLFIPKGFAHGYCTLEQNTEFLYKTDNLYAPNFEGAIRWDDTDLNISWPVTNPVLSDKDLKAHFFREFNSPF